MDMDFVVNRPFVRCSRLVSGSYSSARVFAPCFFPTRCPCTLLTFTSIRLVKNFHLLAIEHARHTIASSRLLAMTTISRGTFLRACHFTLTLPLPLKGEGRPAPSPL